VDTEFGHIFRPKFGHLVPSTFGLDSLAVTRCHVTVFSNRLFSYRLLLKDKKMMKISRFLDYVVECAMEGGGLSGIC
jgi:hypothetical protein